MIHRLTCRQSRLHLKYSSVFRGLTESLCLQSPGRRVEKCKGHGSQSLKRLLTPICLNCGDPLSLSLHFIICKTILAYSKYAIETVFLPSSSPTCCLSDTTLQAIPKPLKGDDRTVILQQGFCCAQYCSHLPSSPPLCGAALHHPDSPPPRGAVLHHLLPRNGKQDSQGIIFQ